MAVELATTPSTDGVVEKKRKLEDESVAAPAPPPTSSLLIKRLSDKARLPTRGSAFAAGYDLYRCVARPFLPSHRDIDAFWGCSAEKKVVPAKSKALVDTQISIAVPEGTYGRVAPRSGLGAPPRALLSINFADACCSVQVHDRHGCGSHRF